MIPAFFARSELKSDPFDRPGAGSSHDDQHGGHEMSEQETLESVVAILKEISERPESPDASMGPVPTAENFRVLRVSR